MTVRTLFVGILFMQLLTACAQQNLAKTSTSSLVVTPNIVLAGALTARAPDLIKRQKAVVIDLRHPKEGIEAEAELMRSLEVPYFNLPIGPGSFNRTTVNQLDALLTEHAARPIVIHCASGNRAGLLWAALLKERGTSSSAATAAVSGIVTMPQINQAIENYNAEQTNAKQSND
ncbi:MAG: hypothetical protein HKN05_13545 [Rhizobiales bacterium]|nr:hypothetical protein [Hyphomicrobiales bacterium]